MALTYLSFQTIQFFSRRASLTLENSVASTQFGQAFLSGMFRGVRYKCRILYLNEHECHNFRSSSGSISKQLKIPQASVQRIVCKCKNLGTTHKLYLLKGRHKLTPRVKQTLVEKVTLKPKDNNKHTSTSTVYPYLIRIWGI